MTAPRLRIINETLDERIERCLRAMGEVVVDLSLPLAVRKSVWRGYAALHGCRSAGQVAEMEKKKGLR